MAERMKYQVPPTPTEPTAREAMDELIENLHQHGFLRMANDLVKSNSEVGKILVSGLNQPGTQNALQNLSILMMTLGSVPPERLIICCWPFAMPRWPLNRRAMRPVRKKPRRESAALSGYSMMRICGADCAPSSRRLKSSHNRSTVKSKSRLPASVASPHGSSSACDRSGLRGGVDQMTGYTARAAIFWMIDTIGDRDIGEIKRRNPLKAGDIHPELIGL